MAKKGIKTAAGYAATAPSLPAPEMPLQGSKTAVQGSPVVEQTTAPAATPARAAPPTRAAAPAAPAPQPAKAPSPKMTEGAQMAELTRNDIVEVDVSYERGPNHNAEPLKVATEVWTQNNVYAVDSRMRCVAVRSVADNKLVEDHPFLGTRLVGGQIKGDDTVEMSYPLPRPGSFAVFEGRKGKKRRFSRTSAVERVVLRLRVVTIMGPDATPSWEDVVSD